MIRSRAMQANLKVLSAIAVMSFSLVVSCSFDFRRPTPAPDEYRQEYLPEISARQIVDLKFTYSGAVGGFISIARVALAYPLEPEQLSRFTDVQQYRPGGTQEELERLRFETATGSTNPVPQWFDLDLDQPLTVLADAGSAFHRRLYLTSEGNPIYLIISGR